MSFFDELKRRHVVRVGIAYVVVAWLILQVADVILNNIDAPSWIFKAILLLLAIGLPLALFFAWVFEVTPEGIKRDDEVESGQPVLRNTGRKLDIAIIALLAVALAYFAIDKFISSGERQAAKVESTGAGRAPDTADNSIAVLPFVNMSADEGQEYFSDGLSQELISLLAQVPALRVIARSSSFSYKGKDKPIADVSRELNVNHVLEGSVRKAGPRVRVTAQLIDADDSSNLWTETYDRTLDDIFEIQDEIASAVVAQLKVELLGEAPSAQQTDPDAYALFLQARELARQANVEGYTRSIVLYEQALAIAPDYAAAWAGLAENHVVIADKALGPIDESYAKAREAANKAVAIDPDFGFAYAILGRIAMVRDKNLQAAADNFELALSLSPADPQVIRFAAILFTNLGRLDEAIDLLEYAAARDPVNTSIHSNLALNYFCAGRNDEALASYRTALDLSPGASGLPSFIGTALLMKDEPRAALEVIKEEPSEPWRLVAEIMAYHALSQKQVSDARLAEMTEKYGSEWGYNIAYAQAFRGEADRAFELLYAARKLNDAGLSEVATAPEFAKLKSDPRWLPFLESIGMAPEQLAAIDFKITRPE